MDLLTELSAWRAAISEQFNSGEMNVRQAVKKRGYLAAKVTKLLNEARDFTKQYENAMPPATKTSVAEIRFWLRRIDNAITRLVFLNEHVKGLFTEETRIETNNDWVRTEHYCAPHEDAYLKTRYNLFFLLFILIDTPEKDNILKTCLPEKRNFATFPIPDGQLRDPPLQVDMDQMIPGLPVDDGLFQGFGEEGEEEDFDATVRPVEVGIMQSGGDGSVRPKIGIAAGHGKPQAASTLKVPLQTILTDKQGGLKELFTGPTLVKNIFDRVDHRSSGAQREDNLLPNDFNHIYDQDDDIEEIGPSSADLGRNENVTTNRLLEMVSKSLGSNFTVTSHVTEKYNGDPLKFEKWAMQWAMCHDMMENYGLDDTYKFQQLLKTLTGNALSYCKAMPPHLPSSYKTSLRQLYKVFNQRKTTARSLVEGFMNLPQCTSQYNSRIQLHAALSSFEAAISALQLSAEEILFLWQWILIEQKLDFDMKKNIIRFCEKRKSDESNLGYDIDFDTILNQILRYTTESYKISGEKSAGPSVIQNQRTQNPGGRRWFGAAGAAAAETVGQSGGMMQKSRGQKPLPPPFQPKKRGGATGGGATGGGQQNITGGSKAKSGIAVTGAVFTRSQNARQNGDRKFQDKKVIQNNCCFCKLPNSQPPRQEFPHKFSRSCPLLKLKILSPEKIKEICRLEHLCRNCLEKNCRQDSCSSPPYIKCDVPGCLERHYFIFHSKTGQERKVQWAAAPAVAWNPNSPPPAPGPHFRPQ